MKELLTIFGKIANISPDDCRQVRKSLYQPSCRHSVEVILLHIVSSLTQDTYKSQFMKELLTIFGKIANISPDDCRQVGKLLFLLSLKASNCS